MSVNRSIKVVIVIDDSDSVSRTSILKFCIFDSEIDGGSTVESNPISQSALLASDTIFFLLFYRRLRGLFPSSSQTLRLTGLTCVS